MTAVKEDEIVPKNPCRITGADQEKPAERPVLNVAQVFKLADAVPARYRALVLVTTFACLRWGEVTALQRQDIDPESGAVRIRQAFIEHRGTGLVLGPPKSRAGKRTVSLPAAVLPAVRQHLAEYVAGDDSAFVFTGSTGRPIWRGNFNNLAKWPEAVHALNVPGLHFHDLRHSGNTFAAKTGASLRDLMARMGRDSPDAALIYQDATREADQAIADAVSAQVKAEQKKTRKAAKKATSRKRRDPDDGAAGALVPTR
jgi:integrase